MFPFDDVIMENGNIPLFHSHSCDGLVFLLAGCVPDLDLRCLPLDVYSPKTQYVTLVVFIYDHYELVWDLFQYKIHFQV